MKSFANIKKHFILILLITLLCSLSFCITKKNFLKSNIEKNLKTKTENKVRVTVEVQKMSTESPLVANHNLKEQTEEEKYELERANAMAEFIF